MRIGLVGAGAVGRYHLEAAQSIPGVVMTSICDPKAGAADLIDPSGQLRRFIRYEDLLAADAVDAVIINTPHHLHDVMAIAALERDLHVLVEKPMATSISGCEQMIESAARSATILAIGHVQHFLPDKVQTRAILTSGSLGRVVAINDRRTTDYRPGVRPDWFYDRKRSGGGALFNLGAHCIDRAVWLGGASVESVRAWSVDRFGSGIETDGHIWLTLSNGIEVNISILSETAEIADEITIICEKGSVTCSADDGVRTRIDGVTSTVALPHPRPMEVAFRAQLLDFVNATDGSKLAVQPAHARHVVEVAQTAYRYISDGRSMSAGLIDEVLQ